MNSELLKQRLYQVYRDAKKLPGISALTQTTAWRILKFKITLLMSSRRNCHFTRFLRMPSQFEALSGPVFDFLVKDGTPETLKVAVMGCSTGAEVYSIASVLRSRHPDITFSICAYDIDRGCVDKAKSAQYTPEEVLKNKMITSDFIDATFDIENGYYIIKDDIRKHVYFDVGDALDPKLKEKLGMFDIIYVQQLLIHLKRNEAVRGFKNICRLLNPKAALFIAGVDLDLLEKLTRKHGLIPCEYKIEAINNEIMVTEGGWPHDYSSREPFMTVKKDWQRRYSTIFFKS